jgi:hypothetical protein
MDRAAADAFGQLLDGGLDDHLVARTRSHHGDLNRGGLVP